MARILPTLALAGATLGLVGCGPETNRITPLANPTLYTAHQPLVTRTNYVLDLRSGYGALPEEERVRLNDWFGSLGLRYGDQVFLDAGGYPDPAVAESVAQVLAGYGLLLSHGAPITADAGRGGAVRVVVARAEASVPNCPLWEDELVGAPERAATNYGCATQSNLANMIANPNDLIRGQGGNGTTGADRAKRSSADGPADLGNAPSIIRQ